MLATERTRLETHLWEKHGPLRVSANGHYLQHEDGTGLVWIGDTAWQLAKIGPRDIDRYLENRAAKGFNVIQFTSTTMSGRPNYAGEVPFLGERPYANLRLNERYWEHIDYIVRRGREVGLYLAMFSWWGQAVSNPHQPDGQLFVDPPRAVYAFGRAMGERYGGEPHVIWVAAGEYQKPFYFPPVDPEHLCTLARFIEGVRETEALRHLATIHALSGYSSADDFHDADWLDFHMVQTHTNAAYIDSLIDGDWRRAPAKPTVNGEGFYEAEEPLFERQTGYRRMLAADYDSAWMQRYQLYWSLFFGGIGYTYGHKHLWTMTDGGDARGERGALSQHALDAPGSGTLRHGRALLESKPVADRVPDQDLLTTDTLGTDSEVRPNLRCATRAADGSWAMVYTTRGEVIGLRLDRLAAGRAELAWYNPRNGLWHVDGSETEHRRPFATGVAAGPGTPAGYYQPPGSPGDTFFKGVGAGEGNDWVLVVDIS